MRMTSTLRSNGGLEQIMEILGLPNNVVSFVLKAEVGQDAEVECVFYPNEHADSPVTRRFSLIEIPDALPVSQIKLADAVAVIDHGPFAVGMNVPAQAPMPPTPPIVGMPAQPSAPMPAPVPPPAPAPVPPPPAAPAPAPAPAPATQAEVFVKEQELGGDSGDTIFSLRISVTK